MALNKHPHAKVHVVSEPFVFETPFMGKTETIPILEVGYEEWGDPCNPTILVCHALSMNTHAHDPDEPESERSGWWNPMVGPGRAVDTNHFHVLCVNMLGGCGGTSGPASINPDTGEPYGLHFPVVTVGDMVRSQKLLLDALGIERVYAVIGGSMGGFQALVWAIMYPEMVERSIVIASSAYSNQFQIMTNRAQIDAIQLDANYNSGRYKPGSEPLNGLAIAREIGFCTFISPLMMEKKFNKYHESDREPFTDGRFHLQRYHEAEDYLHRVARPFSRDFDANSMIYLLQTWNHYDLAVRYGSLAKAMAPVEAEIMVIAASGDNLFPPTLSEDIVKGLHANGKHVVYELIDEDYGHDFFLIGDIVKEKIAPPLIDFLSR